jgi:hypothetical protein
MAGTCLWRSWTITLEWDADAAVPQDVRDRLAAFLEHVLAAIADLAAALTDATDDDLVAVLGPHLLRLPGPAWGRTVEALASVIPGRYTETTDADRLQVWMAAVDRALEGKDLTVQWAIVAVLLERVLRARLASPEPEDPDALDHAADVLAASMVGVLQEVCSRAIPPQAYHVM